MKIKIASYCATLLLAASVSFAANEPFKPHKGSAELERMKSLVGTWKGKVDMGQGPVDMTVQYRVLAAGSTVEERVFAGTPNEMVTMYYDKGGKLALTHYCVMGNRPAMVLKSSDSDTLKFDFDGTCGIDPKTESHMHALTIHFDDADTISTTCKSIMNGQEMESHPTTLKRVSS